MRAWISARPTLRVALLTEVAVNRTLVTDRAVNDTLTGPPASSSAGTATVVPSEKVSVPAVTWSSGLGRS
nr:hypothetical protein [Geodermatophilus normandii]